MTVPTWLVPTLIGVVALVAVATAVLVAARVAGWWEPMVAIARALVQLAVLSVILSGVISNPVWVAVALIVMFTVASIVATRRGGWSLRSWALTAGAIGAGAMTAVAGVFATGALEPTARYLLAVGAIVIGNSMSVATLTNRLFRAGRIDHWDEVEGWLALGATPRRATVHLARQAVRDALIPSIDQTKTTGLVVLPGAFVGAIFGGLSPWDAARFQLLVLAAILAAGAVAAVLLVAGAGRDTMRPALP